MLDNYHKNTQCKKIFIVGCHDNPHLRRLCGDEDDEPYADERIVLLGVNFDPWSLSFDFPIMHSEHAFRSETLPSEGSNVRFSRNNSSHSRASSTAIFKDIGRLSSPNEQSPSTTSTSMSANHSANTLHSLSTTGAEHRDVNPNRNNGIGKRRVIQYNANHIRLDAPNISPRNAYHWESYQEKYAAGNSKGFCNQLYLTGRCPRRDICRRIHNVALTRGELAIHKYKARLSLCPNGPKCDDFDCYSSHHCPYGLTCRRRSKCKFTTAKFGDLHLSGIDNLVA